MQIKPTMRYHNYPKKKCAYLNDKNLYVSGKLPIGAKQLRIRVVIKGELQGK